eukprot:9258029-Lingulodinium_polyedra.AAC.1
MHVIAKALYVPKFKACKTSRAKLWIVTPSVSWKTGFRRLATVVFAGRQKDKSTGKRVMVTTLRMSKPGSAQLGIKRSPVCRPSSGSGAASWHPSAPNSRYPRRRARTTALGTVAVISHCRQAAS